MPYYFLAPNFLAPKFLHTNCMALIFRPSIFVCGGGAKNYKKVSPKFWKLYEYSNLKLGSPPQSYLLATASYVFCFFFRLFDLGLHWRRFIGGREFVSHIFQTLFTDHSFTHSFATEEKSDNRLKKRKHNALKEYVINEL